MPRLHTPVFKKKYSFSNRSMGRGVVGNSACEDAPSRTMVPPTDSMGVNERPVSYQWSGTNVSPTLRPASRASDQGSNPRTTKAARPLCMTLSRFTPQRPSTPRSNVATADTNSMPMAVIESSAKATSSTFHRPTLMSRPARTKSVVIAMWIPNAWTSPLIAGSLYPAP
jgi:hypothetical protein